MVLFYLILKAIFKAGQLCFAAVAMCVFLSCSADDVIEPILPGEEEPVDSVIIDRDSIPSIEPDSLLSDTTSKVDVTEDLVTFSDVDFTPSFWASLKADPIHVRKPCMDSEEWFGAEPYFTCQGFDLYENASCMFSVDITPSWSEDFEGELCLAYLDATGAVIGQTYATELSGSRERTLTFFDHLAFPAGRIRVLPVVRRRGTSDWVAPISSGYYNPWYMAVMAEHEVKDWPDADWGFTIHHERSEGRLMVRDLYNDGMTEGSYRSATNNIKSKGQEFTIHYVLANPSRKAMRGTLILKDEHGFTEAYQTYRPCQKVRKNSDLELKEWSREVGRMEVEIPEGAEGWKGSITGKIDYSNYLGYASSCQHLYFLPEGASEAYLLTKDWRHLLAAKEKGGSASWGANAAWIKVN